MVETKTIDIRGVKYTIRKMTLGTRQKFLKMQAENPTDAQALIIKDCVVDPVFKSMDDVLGLDYDVADILSLEISEFNKPSEDFLQRSKSLLSKASPLPETKQ